MTPKFLPLIPLLLMLAGAPHAAARECPPHIEHCHPPEIVGELLAVTIELSYKTDTEIVAEPPAEVSANASVTMRVTLTLTGPQNATTNATVNVSAAEGVTYAGPDSLTRTLAVGTPEVFEFPLVLSDDWPPGDYVFLPLAVNALGKTSTGHGVLQVADEPEEVVASSWLYPVLLGTLGLVVGATATWGVLRTRE